MPRLASRAAPRLRRRSFQLDVSCSGLNATNLKPSERVPERRRRRRRAYSPLSRFNTRRRSPSLAALAATSTMSSERAEKRAHVEENGEDTEVTTAKQSKVDELKNKVKGAFVLLIAPRRRLKIASIRN